MKRGFLKKPSNPPSPPEDKDVQAPREPQHELVSIPEMKITRGENVPRKGKFPTQNFDLSIVTLPWPSIFRPMERVAVCLLYPGTKEKILALPNFPSPIVTPKNSFQITYSIKDLNGFGKGMLAEVTFQPGELILSERPLIILPVVLPFVKGASTHPDAISDQLVNLLSEQSRKTFYELHNCKKSSMSPRIRGIIDTNCLDIGGLPGEYGGGYGAICPLISRINHR